MTGPVFRAVERVGTTAERAYVVVTVELRELDAAERVTVDHEAITGAVVEFAVTGEVYAAHTSPRNGHDAIMAGQCVDALDEVTTPAPGWTLEEIRELREVWERWHLNGMRAACSHMVPAELVREDTAYGSRIACRANRCPAGADYFYGAAWLVEQLPTAVVERVRYLMRDRSADLYRSRGYDAGGRAYPEGDR